MAYEDWEKIKIFEIFKQLKTAEKRDFEIAYAKLDEKYHGYLEQYPNYAQLWYKKATDDELKSLKSKLDPSVYNSNKDKLMVKIHTPYLNLDGMLAMANDDHKDEHKYDVICNVISLVDKFFVQADIDSTLHGKRTGYAEIERGDVGKASSAAIRKALNYFGYGRFPLAVTDFK